MNRKILLSIIILTGALGQLYNHYVNGITYNKMVARDKSGFVVDGLQVKVTASSEEIEAYKKLIDGEVVKDIKAQLKDVEKQQQQMMKQLDEVSGIDASAGNGAGEVLIGNASDGGGDDIPSLPPVPEETGSLPTIPDNPEAGEKDTETVQATPLTEPPTAELPPLPSEDPVESKSAGESAERNQLESTGGPSLEEKDLRTESGASMGTNTVEEDSELSRGDDKAKFDPIKELAARNLMSCKTKNSKGRIPALIWNYIVSRSTATEFVTTGDETLPQIAVKLLNDESCWPKLWSQNPDLENPYDIPSGLTISVIPDAPRVPANNEDSEE